VETHNAVYGLLILAHESNTVRSSRYRARPRHHSGIISRARVYRTYRTWLRSADRLRGSEITGRSAACSAGRRRDHGRRVPQIAVCPVSHSTFSYGGLAGAIII
jgi:hypothetical protein